MTGETLSNGEMWDIWRINALTSRRHLLWGLVAPPVSTFKSQDMQNKLHGEPGLRRIVLFFL